VPPVGVRGSVCIAPGTLYGCPSVVLDVRASRDAENAEFSAYVLARWPALLRAARLLGCPAHAVEDLVQSALVKCYVAWPRVTAADDRDAYVYRVLVNAYRSERRRPSSRETPTDPPRDEQTTEFDTSGVATSVEKALASLTPESRQIVVLRYFADLTEQQTADALGIPIGTVKSRASRARALLSEDPNLADLQHPRRRQ
jgi:RNA polymerase sigma-70 factor (sigma-E family)